MKREDLKYIDFDNDPKVAEAEADAAKNGLMICWGPTQWTQNETLQRLLVIDRGDWVGCKIIYKFKRREVISRGLCKEPLTAHVFEVNEDRNEYLGSFSSDQNGTNLDSRGNPKEFVLSEELKANNVEVEMDYHFGLLSLTFKKFPGLVDVVCSYEWENR